MWPIYKKFAHLCIARVRVSIVCVVTLGTRVVGTGCTTQYTASNDKVEMTSHAKTDDPDSKEEKKPSEVRMN